MILSFMVMNDDAGVQKQWLLAKTMGQFSKIFAVQLIGAGVEWSHRMCTCWSIRCNFDQMMVPAASDED